MWDYLQQQRQDIAFNTYQHLLIVVQAVALATVLAIAVAVLVTRVRRLEPFANTFSAIGLTLPSFALVGLCLPIFGIKPYTAFTVVTFFAILPVLRNAVVGFDGVDKTLVESARGMGMGPAKVLLRVQLPLAWPVVLAGVRTSTQMSMGVAAIAAIALGPGLGTYIYSGLAQYGGANALNSALVGTVGVVLLALAVDAVLVLVGRLTISKGIRA